jgi:hypothetical protein
MSNRDPLGPLLFSLVINEMLQGVNCEFVSGYLDDVALGDSVQQVIEALKILEIKAKSIGLCLNHTKCEVIGLSAASSAIWASSGLHYLTPDLSKATLLGAPLQVSGVDSCLEDRQSKLELAAPRLSKMAAPEALFLLKNSLAIPKLMFTLRTSPYFRSSLTVKFDS